MNNPQQFLLERIVLSHKTGGRLGSLNAQFVDELTEVIGDFAELTVIDVMNRLKKGEVIELSNGNTIELQTIKSKKKQFKPSDKR